METDLWDHDRATMPTHQNIDEMITNNHGRKEGRSADSGVAKKLPQW